VDSAYLKLSFRVSKKVT